MTSTPPVPRMPGMRLPVRRLLAGLVFALCAATAMPQVASLYTVEILVFRNAGTAGALPDNSASPAILDDGIEATPAVTSKLVAAARRLADAGEFRVLAHTAWTQGPSAWPEGAPWYSGRGISTRQIGIGNVVDGRIYLLQGRQLNLGMVLTVEDGGRRYQLSETRTVKANEINYYDHPAVGVLAIVTAVSGN